MGKDKGAGVGLIQAAGANASYPSLTGLLVLYTLLLFATVPSFSFYQPLAFALIVVVGLGIGKAAGERRGIGAGDSVVVNFKTDGLGFRRFKEVVGQRQTWFVYDLAESETPGLAPLVAEYDANGNLVAKYHHDGGGLLAMSRGNANYWYAYEAIGTTRQLMNAQGQVTDTYAFDAWGNELAAQVSTVNPHRYVGKQGYYLDTESVLMLLGVRYYSSGAGRFTSPDPAASRDNLYVYASANPLLNIDPSGLWDSDAVHFKCTVDWVAETFVAVPFTPGKFAVLRDPNEVGEGSRDLDYFAPPTDFYFSGIATGYHFNFSKIRGDLQRWIKGQPAVGADTRLNYLQSMFQEAARLCQAGNWRLGLYVLGKGLHSLQDSFSHLDLTAAEHQTSHGNPPQNRCVDDPDCDRGPEVHPSPRPYKGPYQLIFRSWKVRVFKWHKGTSRFNKTESETKNWVSQFILRVLGTPCVKIVCKKPPKLPDCRKRGSCGDGN